MKRASWMIPLAATAALLPALVIAAPPGGRMGFGPLGPGRGGPPAFLSELYPPALVMRHQEELALTDEQRSAIMAAVREARDSREPAKSLRGQDLSRFRGGRARAAG